MLGPVLLNITEKTFEKHFTRNGQIDSKGEKDVSVVPHVIGVNYEDVILNLQISMRFLRSSLAINIPVSLIHFLIVVGSILL